MIMTARARRQKAASMAVRMSADLFGILRLWIHRHCGIHGSQTQKSIHGAQTNTDGEADGGGGDGDGDASSEAREVAA